VRGVDAGAIAAAHPDAPELPQRIRTARLKALRSWGKDERVKRAQLTFRSDADIADS
jgi:hypothetical protein